MRERLTPVPGRGAAEDLAARLAPVLAAAIWVGSVGALWLAMWAWMGADRLARWHGMGRTGAQARHLEAIGLVAVLVFAGLQVVGLLVTAWALRTALRVQVSASFAGSGALMMVLDAAGLVGLLVWLRVSAGVN